MSAIRRFQAPWDKSEIYEDVEVEVGYYGNGSLAIRLTLEDGDVLAIPTINLQQYGVVPPKDCVFIPARSENEGMLAALIGAGVVEDMDIICDYGPYNAYAQQAKVLPPYLPEEVAT